jgi:hypothetical protein
MKAKEPLKFTLLFRTYNKDLWCKHSDEDTSLVMLVDDEYAEIWSEVFCMECIKEELELR